MGQIVMGIDTDSLKTSVPGASRISMAERARLQSELKAAETLMPYAKSPDLLRWLDEQRSKAVENMVSARDDESRRETQALVRAWSRMKSDLEGIPARFEQVAAMLARL